MACPLLHQEHPALSASLRSPLQHLPLPVSRPPRSQMAAHQQQLPPRQGFQNPAPPGLMYQPTPLGDFGALREPPTGAPAVPAPPKPAPAPLRLPPGPLPERPVPTRSLRQAVPATPLSFHQFSRGLPAGLSKTRPAQVEPPEDQSSPGLTPQLPLPQRPFPDPPRPQVLDFASQSLAPLSASQAGPDARPASQRSPALVWQFRRSYLSVIPAGS